MLCEVGPCALVCKMKVNLRGGGAALWPGVRLSSRTAWVQIPSPPVTSWVSLGELLKNDNGRTYLM